jgi:molybdopterin converting factor subunit 1
MVRIDVLYFGMLKEFFGGERDVVELAEGATVDDLLDLLRGRSPNDLPVWKSLGVAVNREYSGAAAVLHEGDEVALLPPVSGGSGAR